MDHSNRSGPPRDRRGVSPELQRQIDENLRRLYADAADEALPEQLQTLIQRLRARDDAR
ncbi:MAG: NepR family anti-sigma factor [Alkalilacustris sp.]